MGQFIKKENCRWTVLISKEEEKGRVNPVNLFAFQQYMIFNRGISYPIPSREVYKKYSDILYLLALPPILHSPILFNIQLKQ